MVWISWVVIITFCVIYPIVNYVHEVYIGQLFYTDRHNVTHNTVLNQTPNLPPLLQSYCLVLNLTTMLKYMYIYNVIHCHLVTKRNLDQFLHYVVCTTHSFGDILFPLGCTCTLYWLTLVLLPGIRLTTGWPISTHWQLNKLIIQVSAFRLQPVWVLGY